MKTMLALALVATVACGCASGMSRSRGDQVLDRYEPYIGEPIRDFSALNQQSWQPVSRNQLILWTGMNDAYLLTTVSNCPDLNFAHAVRVTSTANQISTLDQVLVGNNRCPIERIQPIDIRQWRKDRNANQRDS